MSGDEGRFDARMRSLVGRLDAQPGFEARVAARVAALGARADNIEDLRARYEHRREVLRRRLSREAWTHGLTIGGIGLAAIALIWRFAPEIRNWGQTADPSAAFDPLQIGGYSSVVLLAILWPLMRKLPLFRNF